VRLGWLLLPAAVLACALAAVPAGVGADGPPEVRPAAPRPSSAEAWKVVAKLYSPDDAAKAALDDVLALVKAKLGGFTFAGETKEVEKLKEQFARQYGRQFRHYRYLTAYNYPEALRDGLWQDTSFLINSLSRKDEIVRPAVGGPGNILVRIDLRHYDIDPKDWDDVCLQGPYFHQDIDKQEVTTEEYTDVEEQDWKGGVDKDGKYYPPGKYKVEVKKTRVKPGKAVRQRALAGWVDPAVNAQLAFLLQARAPIERADWWVANASVPPNYYRLLRLKSLKDFLELAAWDERAEERKEVRATVVKSGSHGLATPVARNNRILSRTPTFQGYLWQTFDFQNSLKARNVINNFLNIREEAGKDFASGEHSGRDPRAWLRWARKQRLGFRDAGEWIATLPNGLQFYFLTDGEDNRLDEAAINVAYDSTSHDFRVINGRSCIWCHTDGIRPFKSQFQLQVGQRQQTDLGVALKDPDRAAELNDYIRRAFGSPDFDDYVKGDQAFYAKHIKAANGLTPERNASLFRSHWDGYAEVDLDLNRVCYELGLQPAQVKAILALRFNGVNDGVLLQQLLRPPIAIRRDQWEEVYAKAALTSLLLKKGQP
jgi:hypothetical protein